jgi:protein-tyrosine phosphatase
VLAMAPNEEAAAKVRLLLGDKEVPDPYYDDSHFEPVFTLIEQGCKDLIKEIT